MTLRVPCPIGLVHLFGRDARYDISLTHAHGPAPCGPIAYSRMFSLFLFDSLRLRILFDSLPFYSIPSDDIPDIINFYSILFDSFRFVSLPFSTILRSARDLRHLAVYKPLYDIGGVLSLT